MGLGLVQQRFGAALHLFFLPVFVATISRLRVIRARQLALISVVLTLAGYSVVRVHAYTKHQYVHTYISRASKSLVKELALQRVRKVYLVNDLATGFTAPSLVARFAGFQGELIKIADVQLEGAEHQSSQPQSFEVAGVAVRSILPPGYRYVLYGANSELLARQWGAQLQRNAALAVEFPRGTPQNLGRELVFHLKEAAPVIYYDFRAEKYATLFINPAAPNASDPGR